MISSRSLGTSYPGPNPKNWRVGRDGGPFWANRAVVFSHPGEGEEEARRHPGSSPDVYPKAQHSTAQHSRGGPGVQQQEHTNQGAGRLKRALPSLFFLTW